MPNPKRNVKCLIMEDGVLKSTRKEKRIVYRGRDGVEFVRVDGRKLPVHNNTYRVEWKSVKPATLVLNPGAGAKPEVIQHKDGTMELKGDLEAFMAQDMHERLSHVKTMLDGITERGLIMNGFTPEMAKEFMSQHLPEMRRLQHEKVEYNDKQLAKLRKEGRIK